MTTTVPTNAGVFTKGCCREEDIAVYYIAAGNILIHLTFSADRHRTAVARINAGQRRTRFVANPSFADDTRRRLKNYIHTGAADFRWSRSSPFFKQGTEFQKKVWGLIALIPCGGTRSYGELAGDLGGIGYARAVGQACRANPMVLIIPCHRVTGRRGTGGFVGGAGLKERLLAIEQRIAGGA